MNEKIISFLEKRDVIGREVLANINMKCFYKDYRKPVAYVTKPFEQSINDFLNNFIYQLINTNGAFSPIKNLMGLRKIASIEQLFGIIVDEKIDKKEKFDFTCWDKEAINKNYYTDVCYQNKVHKNIPIKIFACNENVTIYSIRKDYCENLKIEENKKFTCKTKFIYEEHTEVTSGKKVPCNIMIYGGIDIISDKITKENDYCFYDTILYVLEKNKEIQRINNFDLICKDFEAIDSIPCRMIFKRYMLEKFEVFFLIENKNEEVNGIYEIFWKKEIEKKTKKGKKAKEKTKDESTN